MYYIFQRACVHWFTWRKVFFSLQTRYRPDELKTWHQQLNTSPKISPPTCSRTFLYTLRKWRMKWTWALHSHYSPWTVMTHWLMWFHLSDVTPAIHFFFLFSDRAVVQGGELYLITFSVINRALLLQHPPNTAFMCVSKPVWLLTHTESVFTGSTGRKNGYSR